MRGTGALLVSISGDAEGAGLRSCPGNIGQKLSTVKDWVGRIQKTPSCLPLTGLWVGIFEKTMPV